MARKMWRRFKGLFVKSKHNYTGFKVEFYRDGVLMFQQCGGPTERIYYDLPPQVCYYFKGFELYGYTLIPNLTWREG